MTTSLRRSRRIALACVGVGVVLVGAAGGWELTRGTGPAAHTASVPTVNAGSIPATAATHSSQAATPVISNARSATNTPVVRQVQPIDAAGARLAIPRMGVDAPIVSIGDTNRTLDVPLDPKVLGWWRGSAKPGSGTGTVVIDGHINYDGVAGTLSVLPNLRIGDRITISRDGKQLAYRVSALRTLVKAGGLPAELFDQNVSERLVLITCGGPFDASTGNYEDNVVAYATPAAS